MTRGRRAADLAWLAILASATLSCAAVAAAASAQSLVVLRVDPAAEPLCRALESRLSAFRVNPDPGYFEETQRRGLDPSGDEALTTLTPPLQVDLVLVPQSAAAGAVLIEFREGGSGASLGTASIPLERGAVGWQAQRLLELEIRRRLSNRQSAAAPASDEAPGVDEQESESEPVAEESSGDDDGLFLRVFGGAGMGTRVLSWPASGEMLSVDSGAFLAVEVGGSFGLDVSPTTQLGPELVYQTSLDHEVEERHVGGATDTMGLRAHRFEALLALTLRLGSSRAFRVAPALGYALRNLRPDVHHLQTPGYTLAGPLLRVTVRIPFGDSVALRLSPEVQFALVGDELEERGVESTGLAFGGQGGLEIALSAECTLELTFREAHALMPSSAGDDATDVERFATARFVWQP